MDTQPQTSSPRSTQPNRRRTQRRTLRSTVRIECRKGWLGMGKNITTSVVDVSQNGLRLVLHTPVDFNQEVELLIHAEGYRQPLKRIANVVWVEPTENNLFSVGLEFQKSITYADVARLARPQ